MNVIVSRTPAAIFADALNHKTFEKTADLLERGEFAQLWSMLTKANKLERYYWVCAFSVNQHVSICSGPRVPKLDSLKNPIHECPCCMEKISSGASCEVNKFDEMMALLK